MKREIICVLVCAFLIAAIFPSNSLAENMRVQKNTLEKDYINVTVGMLTFFGRQEITRSLRLQDAQNLSEKLRQTHQAIEQLQNSDSSPEIILSANTLLNTTIDLLQHYHFLPNTMTKNQTRSLMTGEYGRKIYDRLMSNHESNQPKEKHPGSVYRNIACYVHGYGFEVYGRFFVNPPFIINIYAYLFDRAWVFYDTGHFLLGAVFEGLSLIPYFTDFILAIFPRFFIPIGIITLDARSGWNDDTAIVGSIGLGGHWVLEEKGVIKASMIGFVGLYHPWGFTGFAASISAAGTW